MVRNNIRRRGPVLFADFEPGSALRVALVAGEHSGDQLGGKLMLGEFGRVGLELARQCRARGDSVIATARRVAVEGYDDVVLAAGYQVDIAGELHRVPPQLAPPK